MKKVLNALHMDKETGIVDMVDVGITFTIDGGEEAMTINVGTHVFGFRFDDVQKMIRQERMRNG